MDKIAGWPPLSLLCSPCYYTAISLPALFDDRLLSGQSVTLFTGFCRDKEDGNGIMLSV